MDVLGQPIGSIVNVKESKEQRNSYYNCCFIPSVNEQYMKSLEIDLIISYLFVCTLVAYIRSTNMRWLFIIWTI
jgi:hypothetical protein